MTVIDDAAPSQGKFRENAVPAEAKSVEGPAQAESNERLKDGQWVVKNEVKEWHFHIYFLLNDPVYEAKARTLRDAVLALRKQGVFVAVPLWRVNTAPIGPHPVGSYEIWVPRESFSSVFSFLALNHGDLSILIHPLTRNERADHDSRKAWIGQPFPIHLGALPVESEQVPLQYPSIGYGYSSKVPELSMEEREKRGRELEEKLKDEPEAALTP